MMSTALLHIPYAVGIITPVFILFVLSYIIRRKKALKGHPSLVLGANSTVVELVRFGALYTALVSTILVLSSFVYEKRTTVPLVEGLEIATLIDCSRSMLAPVGDENFTPRLRVVTTAVDDALRRLKADRWGIGCFSERLNGISPLSNDYERLLRPKLDVMEDHRYIELVGKGSNFAAGIEGCMKIFNVKKTNKKVCIILSDGEPQGDEAKLQDALVNAVAEMKSLIALHKLDVSFYLVGVGSPEQPYKIPAFDDNGNPIGFLMDSEGNAWTTRPDPEYLKRIADQFQGEYIHLKPGELLSRILEDIMNVERRRVGEKEEVTEVEMATPFILLLIVSLFVFMVCPKRISGFRSLRNKKVHAPTR